VGRKQQLDYEECVHVVSFCYYHYIIPYYLPLLRC
jgi:hypothetical protein